MAVTFLVITHVARYLEPSGFGALSYSLAIVQFLILVTGLGFSNINVRNLVSTPDSRGTIIGTAIIARFVIVAVFTFLVFAGRDWLDKDAGDQAVAGVVFLMSFSLLFRPLDTFEDYFQSQVVSRYAVFSRLVGTSVFAVMQLALVYFQADLIWFGLAFTLRNAISCVGYLYFYLRHYGTLSELRFDKSYLRGLAWQSLPLAFSSVIVFVYMKIDQFMLWNMVTEGTSSTENVGQYSAALRLSEVWFVFGGLLAGSLFPAIVKAKSRGVSHYNHLLQRYFDAMILGGAAVTLPMFVFGPWFLQSDALFGSEYGPAGEALKIHICALVFVYLGSAANKYLILEGLQNIILYRSILGVGINVLLNYLLIPKYGIIGAAYATVVSQCVASYLCYGMSHRTLELFIMMTKSIFFVSLYQGVRNRWNSRR